MKQLQPFLIRTLIAMILVFLPACQNPSSNSAESGDLWSDSPRVSSDLNLGSTAAALIMSSSRSLSRSSTSINEIYFRSSDIEFWSIEDADDIDGIFSSKYQEWGEVDEALGYTDGKSLEYYLGDDDKSVVFTPYNNYSAVLGNGINQNWQARIEDFVGAFTSPRINLARLDIGAGMVTFVIDGEQRKVLNSSKEQANVPLTLDEIDQMLADGEIDQETYDYYIMLYGVYSGFDANSIIFVDDSLLSKPVLIERLIQNEILNDKVTASDLGMSSSDFSIVRKFSLNAHQGDAETMVDVDGALFLPLSPIDISSFDPSINTLQIEVGWDIANAIHVANGEYFMDNRVNKTAFNFSVAISVQ